ncbi:MAG: MarR family transcriptional regulator, partial [Reyranella sp.]|nr:MarR family transcriptional regulator [Reyranella sp.]
MKYKNSRIRPWPRTAARAVPRPGEGKRGPEGHLGYLVRQANVAVRAAMEKAL